MEQAESWRDFWQKWRNTNAEKEEDLYFQVGRTVNKKPVDKELFDLVNQDLIQTLELSANDVLVDFCCGNGLCTYEYKDHVRQIIAVDFAQHLIASANKLKSAPNITYCLGSLFDFLDAFKTTFEVVPTKYCMNGALAYFDPAGFERILKSIINISGSNFKFFITVVPNLELLSNYYNTPERMEHYLANVAKGDIMHEGMGRWWSPAEINELCDRLGLNCRIWNQPEIISNYRMDILISGS